MPGLDDFFTNFTRLASLKNQIDAQRLSERQAAVNMQVTAVNTLAALPMEAREAAINGLAQGTGLDAEFLRMAAQNMPDPVAVTQAKKVQAGAESVDAGQAANVALTGRGIGANAQDTLNAGIFGNINPDHPLFQQYQARLLSGQSAGDLAVDQRVAQMGPEILDWAANVGLGTALSAPQAAGVQQNYAQMAQQDRQFGESLRQNERFQAANLGLEQLRLGIMQESARRQATGQAAMTPDQILQWNQLIKGTTDELSKGGHNFQTQLGYATTLFQAYIMLGQDPERARVMSGLAKLQDEKKEIQPSTWQQYFKNLGAGRSGIPNSGPAANAPARGGP